MRLPTKHPFPLLVTVSQIPLAAICPSPWLLQLGVGKLEVHTKLPETSWRGPAWEPSPHRGKQSPGTQEWLLLVRWGTSIQTYLDGSSAGKRAPQISSVAEARLS